MCRRPVEEIGDGSLSSLKLNPEPWGETLLNMDVPISTVNVFFL